MIAPPALLALAPAVVALIVGLRLRRAGAPGRQAAGAAHAVPRLIMVLARVPVPSGVRGVVQGNPPVATLEGAGLPGDRGAAMVMRARAGGAVTGVLLGAALAVLALPLVVAVPVLALAGRVLPDRVIGRMATARRLAIVQALPDLLDLMVICVESGMALDPALRLAAARLGGPLGDEIAVMLDAQALGTPRRQAYQALAERIGSDDVARLVASLLQAEELGTPLATALAGQAEALRAIRRQLVRDRAARAAPRIQLVVALVMVPGALLLVLGVMLIELAGQIGVVTGV